MLSVFGDSQRTLHDTFMQTYGHLYEKNSDLFEDFFKELRRYYERGNDNLFEITNKLQVPGDCTCVHIFFQSKPTILEKSGVFLLRSNDGTENKKALVILTQMSYIGDLP